ncbi:MAG TPA: hypothetical protein VLJ19_15340 [Variovorax sp.]|nr:hypothetical protein [Variovorax sp.]
MVGDQVLHRFGRVIDVVRAIVMVMMAFVLPVQSVSLRQICMT